MSEAVLDRLGRLSERMGQPRSRVAEQLIDEGIRLREFPGIVFRSGPTGRRAALADGPDVWEVIRGLKYARSGKGDPVEVLIASSDLREDQIRMAADYYSAYPDEVDARIREDEEAAVRLRELLGVAEDD
ncbi:hypothetical protein [Gaiella sp.]|jgi:hypothetical protein|uniref:hypothetical protein n=1 Tax=Gaiella sp. TaxID=2663207 RepID=UPI002E3431F0|nr:hypothetical protein [Gaiella sp.]HEX5582854.1 hypothetical protein [Gaiella sp.]